MITREKGNLESLSGKKVRLMMIERLFSYILSLLRPWNVFFYSIKKNAVVYKLLIKMPASTMPDCGM